VERRVIDWMVELMGYPAGAGGLLVSGATMANLNGLAVARRVQAGFDVRERGLAGGPRLRVYGSVETHSWAERACDLLGLGRQGFRRVAADAEGCVVVEALREALHEDRRGGERPICVVGNAGTVDTGAVDDLESLADLCREEQLWLHVDGAFGALLACAPELRGRLAGLERSDSLAFDLHKWGYLPYEVGCVLVRDRARQRETFQASADYLTSPGRGIQPGPLDFAELGFQLSRGFRALKVWVSLQTHGVSGIGRAVARNVEQARHLAGRVDSEPRLELLAPAPLNVVCFRYRKGGLDEAALETLNREVLLRLQGSGVALPSSW
jgi:glutamate/tyrosine decarboxylase-like PLP-dependent enzyme